MRRRRLPLAGGPGGGQTPSVRPGPSPLRVVVPQKSPAHGTKLAATRLQHLRKPSMVVRCGPISVTFRSPPRTQAPAHFQPEPPFPAHITGQQYGGVRSDGQMGPQRQCVATRHIASQQTPTSFVSRRALISTHSAGYQCHSRQCSNRHYRPHYSPCWHLLSPPKPTAWPTPPAGAHLICSQTRRRPLAVLLNEWSTWWQNP
jgi:hypothetical protein